MAVSISLYKYSARVATEADYDGIYDVMSKVLVVDSVLKDLVDRSKRILRNNIQYYTKEKMCIIVLKEGIVVGCAMLSDRSGYNVIEHINMVDSNSVGTGVLMHYVVNVVFGGSLVVVASDANDGFNGATEKYKDMFKIRDKVSGMLSKTIGSRVTCQE